MFPSPAVRHALPTGGNTWNWPRRGRGSLEESKLAERAKGLRDQQKKRPMRICDEFKRVSLFVQR